MKTISDGLTAALTAEVTTKAHCWRITRRDGTVFRFTDHDADLVISGDTYVASVGYQQTAITETPDLAVNNLEVTGYFDSDFLTAADLRAGLFDFAEAAIFVVDWSNLALGVMKLARTYLGEVRSTPSGIFTTELRGMVQRLMAKVGDVWSPECRADFGSTGLRQCNKDPGAFTFGEIVESVTDGANFTISNSNPAAVDGYYNLGILSWFTGFNSGRSMEVKAWTSVTGVVQLYLPMPRQIVVGDVLNIVAGCDKSHETCKTKFDNMVNRQAEDFIPGMDAIIQTPNASASSGSSGGGGGLK